MARYTMQEVADLIDDSDIEAEPDSYPTLRPIGILAGREEYPFLEWYLAGTVSSKKNWMLHVSTDDPQHPGKRINKVKDIVDILISNFQQSFTPGRNLAVDETMVGFCGRFGAKKQYMPAKPTKYGIKVFTCVDSGLGYVLNFLVYTGGDTLETASSIYSTLPQPARIVLHLLEPYLGKGHTVFTDRYYTSLPLAITLGECNAQSIFLP